MLKEKLFHATASWTGIIPHFDDVNTGQSKNDSAIVGVIIFAIYCPRLCLYHNIYLNSVCPYLAAKYLLNYWLSILHYLIALTVYGWQIEVVVFRFSFRNVQFL